MLNIQVVVRTIAPATAPDVHCKRQGKQHNLFFVTVFVLTTWQVARAGNSLY